MVKITELFDSENITETSSGSYKTECPDCGLQGGRTEGFILFPDSGNNAYCHSSGKSFNFLETVALKNGLIKCIEGREKGENKNILSGQLFVDVLNLIKEEYGEDFYFRVLEDEGLKLPIRIPGNNRLVSDFAKDLGGVLGRKKVLFHRPDLKGIVEIGKIKNPDGSEIDSGFMILKPNRFVTILEKYFNPWTYIPEKGGTIKEVGKSINANIATIVLESPQFQNKMPVINRIFPVQIPIIHNNKLTFPKIGYDERFGSWLPHTAPKIENTEMSLEEAKSIIREIYEEFCFKSKEDFINALASMLTPFLRGLFKKFNTRTPVTIYLANRERAGKDYCAGITGILYEGHAMEEPPISSGDKSTGASDELRKKFMASMIVGRKRMHFANNKGHLNNAVFEGIITSEKYTDRVLGKSQALDFDNELDFSLSGNIGMTMTPDLANRSRIVKLFLDIEDANSREFKKPNLHQWVSENRGTILSALYALVRNWVEKGCPKGSLPFSSFPEWAIICGGVMESAGYDSPCKTENIGFGVSLDNETEEMKSFFEICHSHFGEKWIKKEDIKDYFSKNYEESPFSDVDWASRSDLTKFGIKIEKYVGRLFSDIRLVIENPKVRSNRRKYKFTKEKGEKNKSSIFDNFSENIEKNDENGEIVEKQDFDENLEKMSKNLKNGQNCQKIPKNGQKSGNLWQPWQGYSSTSFNENNMYVYIERGQSLPKLPRLPPPSKSNIIPTKNQNKPKIEIEKTKTKKVKTDRELQFWETPECSEISSNLTEQDVLEWIKANPNKSTQQMHESLGMGALKLRNKLKREGLI